MTAPLPRTNSYIQAVRDSCLSASTALGLTPNTPAIDAFLLSLSRADFDKLKTQHGLSFPLRFPTPTAEVNFLAILALLNALSGYRTAFHKATGAGAYQNVVRLMIGLYIGGGEEDRVVGSKVLTATGLAEVSEAKVVELMGVSVHEEKAHESLPGVTVGVRGGDMYDAVQLVLQALRGVGKKLLESKQGSLGAYIVSLLQQAKENQLDDQQATDFLVRQIAQTFPEFQDSTHLTPIGQDVYIFKRIFFLLHSLRLRFADRPDWMVPDTTHTLPMFVDNVLPTLCVWFNLFSVPSPPPVEGMQTLYDWVARAHCNADLPRDKLDSLQNNVAGPKLSKDETYAVRAATLSVGQAVVERAKVLAKQDCGTEWLAELNEVDLDGYLWAVAKDDAALRKVPRLVYGSIHF